MRRCYQKLKFILQALQIQKKINISFVFIQSPLPALVTHKQKILVAGSTNFVLRPTLMPASLQPVGDQLVMLLLLLFWLCWSFLFL